MHVVDMIAFWAKAVPGRLAVIVPDQGLTYRELAAAIDLAADRIAEHQLDPHGPVAVSIDNEAKLLAVCFALLRLGYTVAPVASSVFSHLPAAGISTLISDGRELPGGNSIRYDDSWMPGRDCSTGRKTPMPGRSETYGDLVFFTSGTTGTPKKIIEKREATLERSHTSVFSGTANYSRILIIPGLSSHFGFNLASDVLRLGKTVCFSGLNERLLWMITTFDIDYVNASPHQALSLCQLQEKHPQYPLDTLKGIRIGGSVPSKALVQRIRARLCKKVTIVYASTEASQAATASYEDIEHVPDAVGFVVPWAELEIVDEHDRPVPVGSEGRVRYRTAYFLKNQGSAGSDAQVGDKWFYPGDIGSLNPEGILCIRGRADDVLNRGGVKISATVVEERLLSCPGVKDAAICAASHASELTQFWLAVVPDATFDADVLMQFIKTDKDLRDALRTDIDQIFVVDEIPRAELGKIRRQELADQLKVQSQDQPPHLFS